MNTAEALGPGVDSWLTEKLISWGFTSLTDVQAKALGAGVADEISVIVSAPTSSGKTLVGEIAVLSQLRRGLRSLYLVSHRALADQKYLDFNSRFGEASSNSLASVALNTGDRIEGDLDAQVLVATYEKALGLILAGQLDPASCLIVADELQILGERSRGPEIEALCSLFRQRGVRQFVALTATVENPEDLAAWLNCTLVRSDLRNVPLHQEIWYSNRVYRVTFGQPEGTELDLGIDPGSNVLAVASQLIALNRQPVLVFTESRKEAMRYAAAFAKSRPRVGGGIALAEQLDLFSEPTESSSVLRENAERRVAFHTADLSSQERQVIEGGFASAIFDVCFATSTLAAGVNFPFQSIVFAKLTYEWGDRAGSHLTRSDYRNMSGRAGRLGLHEQGFAILVPQNTGELAHAKRLVAPENDRLESQLVSLSLRKTILTLIASRLVSGSHELTEFFRNTFYWYQTLENNPKKLKALEDKSAAAIEWLLKNGLLVHEDANIRATPLGHAAAMSGLLPDTAIQLVLILKNHGAELENNFDEYADGLIYAVCASDEFRGEHPSRFLPWPVGENPTPLTYWTGRRLCAQLDKSDGKLARCAQSISQFTSGLAERKIAHATGIPSGAIHRLANEVAWILEGMQRLAAVSELSCSQSLGNNISMLARRVRWGAPADALDVIRIAEHHRVPGFGRQRAMALIDHGIATIHDVLATAKEKLTELLRSDRRAEALLDAASHSIGFGANRLARTHIRLAHSLGIDGLVQKCNDTLGVEFEKAIGDLLRVEASWIVTQLDDGIRQNVPDFLLKLGNLQLLIECKTCTKSPQVIKKEEAWAVMQKGADFDKTMRRVSLGKPSFDETSKKKAAGSHDITLVEYNVFMEGLLRVHAGSLKPWAFLEWLSVPGIAEIERLGGKPTYSS